MSSSELPSASSLSIIVVGAGTAGLITSLALRKKGHDVTVLERSPALRLTGGSYRLNPSVTRLFTELDLQEELLQIAYPSPGVRLRRWSDGTLLANMDSDAGSGFRAMALERHAAGEVFYRKAIENGVKVLFNKRITEVNERIPSVTTENGTTFEADLIVAADGVNSVIRRAITAQKDQDIHIFNEISYNVFVSRQQLESDPELAELFEDSFTNWWVGPAAYVICGSISKEEYFVGVTFQDNRVKGEAATWHETEDMRPVLDRLSQWDPRILKLFTNINRVEHWRIVELPDLQSWSSDSGQVILVGDAAHAIGPHAGSGAAMGIEDGIALAEMLSAIRSKDDIPNATRLFQLFRKPRVRTVWGLSRASWERMSMPNGRAQEERDRFWKEQWRTGTVDWEKVKPNQFSRPRDPSFIKWLMDYDTIAEATQFVKAHNKASAGSRL